MGTYLFGRITAEGKDSRFDKVRTRPAYFAFLWAAQATWVSLLMMPVMALNAVPVRVFAGLPAAVGVTDVVGLGLFAAGFAVEVVADAQKTRWQHEKKAKVHDEQFMTRGLWKRR